MKTCPTCHTQYTDDTLRFCLQDGAALVAAPDTQRPTESFSDGEMETVARQAADSEATQIRPQSEVSSVLPQRSGGSKTAIVVAAIALVMLLLLGIAGIAAWLYFRGSHEIAKNADNPPVNQSKTPQNVNVSISPVSSRTPPTVDNTNSSSPTPKPPPQFDEAQEKRSISGQVQSWASSTEAGDVEAYMSHYAPVVDYYRKGSTSVTFVRADKLRAFSRYDRMQINISNVSVLIGPNGDTAQVEFDKEWDFEGDGRSTGKVRQLLRLRKINGRWMITAEKDLQVLR